MKKLLLIGLLSLFIFSCSNEATQETTKSITEQSSMKTGLYLEPNDEIVIEIDENLETHRRVTIRIECITNSFANPNGGITEQGYGQAANGQWYYFSVTTKYDPYTNSYNSIGSGFAVDRPNC